MDNETELKTVLYVGKTVMCNNLYCKNSLHPFVKKVTCKYKESKGEH